MTTLEMCDKITRIDAKLDMLGGICASASAVDFELVADGMAFTIEDAQSELASIRESLGKLNMTIAQMVALAKELGITVDTLVRAICAVNGESADDTSA